MIVVAFNSERNGIENKPQIFFSQELMPTKSPQNVMFDRNGEYVNISWDELTLSEARGFPVYTVTLTPSVIANGVIVMNTTESNIVVGGLNVNMEYVLTVQVRTTGGQVTSDRGIYTLYNLIIIYSNTNSQCHILTSNVHHQVTPFIIKNLKGE